MPEELTTHPAMASIEEARTLHSAALELIGTQYQQPEYGAAVAECRRIEDEAWKLFGHTMTVADLECRQCRVYSIFGGPNHRPATLCKSGKRNHCSCSACF